MPKNGLRTMATVAAVRIVALLGGVMLMARYADWRQVVEYPLALLGGLPDAIWVRYVIKPQSAAWLGVMVVSLLGASAILSALFGRRGRG